MNGSFGKRMKAFVAFSAGLLPVAATAQSAVPNCTITKEISKNAIVTAELARVDYGPVEYNYQLKLYPSKVKPSRKDLLVQPSATLSFWYQWKDSRLLETLVELRDPYSLPQGLTEPLYEIELDVGGQKHKTSQNGALTEWTAMRGWNIGNALGDLKKDIAVSFRTYGSDAANTFTYTRKDAKKAFEAAGGLFKTLDGQSASGACAVIQRSSPSSNDGGGGGSLCFLTTAACEGVGLADDCWELRTLRRFRDAWLADQPGGAEDIAQYYRQAPAIAQTLRNDPAALLTLYWTRIVPSALAAQLGANRLARRLYTRMMRDLMPD